MRFGSLASGIEAASVAWKPLGMTPAFFSEIDPFCCSLLQQQHPDAPNLGDMNEITVDALRRCGKIDVLVAGTPCQAFSVAGERGGLADPRGQLALRAVQILEYLQPRWFVWENVPGVLSSGQGKDFGAFLGEVAKLGYGWAYRILDAQFFGVPQRRRRVFVVGHLGDWRPAAEVLFESGCVPRNSEKGRKTKSNIAGTVTSGSGRRRGAGVNPSEIVGTLSARTTAGGGLGTDFECSGGLVPVAYRCGGDGDVWESGSVVAALTTGTDLNSHLVMAHGQGGAEVVAGQSRTLTCNHEAPIVFSCKDYGADAGPISPTLRAMGHSGSHANAGGQIAAVIQRAVRRLTPRERERLQGFPDDYTLVTHRGKPAADGPRYKSIGNSIAIPVLRWIGKRLLMVDRLHNK